MAADDSLNPYPDQGFPTDLDAGSSAGNRPASGARRATPGEVLSQGFQGDQNAGDFLGLDTEFTANQSPQQGYAGSPLDLVPPPSSHFDDATQAGYAHVAEPAPMPASDPVQEFAEAPSAFEFGGDLGSEEGELAHGQPPRPKRRALMVGVLLVAGLAAGAVFYGPTLYTRFLGEETKVAQLEKAPSGPEKATSPKSAAPDNATPVGAPKALGSEPSTLTQVPDSQPSAVEPVKVSAPVRPTATRAKEPILLPRTEPPAVDAEDPSETTTDQPVAATLRPSLAPRALGFPDLGSSAYEWASEDQLELIWRGSEVPLEAVRGPAKTLMPRVGNVRVFTTAGDVFEGRLYAVGQNLVWLDGKPGRIGLDGERVERIEVLPPLPEGRQLSGAETQALGGNRVRVRVPGGMLYGRVLKAEGEDVTLALDDGGRVRVKSIDIQNLGSGRAVVVSR